MIVVESYIKDLLFEKECVILPKFGALLSSYKSAYYNSIKSTYYPPSKNIAFNASLTNNDWLLADTISTSESISKEEALELVEAYVATIQTEIQEGKSYKIESIGTFMLNKEGGISFLPTTNSNYFEESYGLESIQISKVQSEEKPTELIKRTKTNKQNTPMAENKKVEEKEKQSPFFIIAPILLLLIAGGAFTWFMVDKTSFKNVASFGFAKKDVQTELVADDSEENSHESDEHASTEESQDWADTHGEDEHHAEATGEEGHDWHDEHATEVHTETEHHDTHAEVAQVENGSYHIVAGAFEIEDNATSFAQNIKGAKIIKGKKYNMVIVGSYDSEESAKSALTSLQSEHGSGLWIFNN